MKKSSKRNRRRRLRRRLVLLFCALVMLASAGYVLHYELDRRDILRRNAGFSALYELAELEPDPMPTYAPDFAPAQTPLATRAPAASLPGSPSPTPTVEATPAPQRTLAIPVDATYTPRATADANTLVYALQTPPPAQPSFAKLQALNPETAGFLTIPGVLSLPVAQRPNDNEFYLTHSFDGEESDGGALFLDGANLLSPEDDCLIVYGHNMKNGTMFRPLVQYEKLDFLKEHPLVRFDTIYEDRLYIPFAALTVTADPGSERYLDIRQLHFDDPGFDRFVHSLRVMSVWDSPVDVERGDKLLLLVTCEYTHDNGRFVLALRERRVGESIARLRSQVKKSE